MDKAISVIICSGFISGLLLAAYFCAAYGYQAEGGIAAIIMEYVIKEAYS